MSVDVEMATATVLEPVSKFAPVRVTWSAVAPMSATLGDTFVIVGAALIVKACVTVEPSPLVSVRV
jgi:hypothetical protein